MDLDGTSHRPLCIRVSDLVIIPSIAEPGAIREEYLKELKKVCACAGL